MPFNPFYLTKIWGKCYDFTAFRILSPDDMTKKWHVFLKQLQVFAKILAQDWFFTETPFFAENWRKSLKIITSTPFIIFRVTKWSEFLPIGRLFTRDSLLYINLMFLRGRGGGFFLRKRMS
jgi:hypothetical protein